MGNKKQAILDKLQNNAYVPGLWSHAGMLDKWTHANGLTICFKYYTNAKDFLNSWLATTNNNYKCLYKIKKVKYNPKVYKYCDEELKSGKLYGAERAFAK